MSKRCFKVIHDFQRTMMWVFPKAPKNFKHDGLKRLKGSPSCSHKCVVLLQQNGCQSMSHVGYLLIPFCLWNTTCSPIIMEVEITQACKGNVLVLEGSHFYHDYGRKSTHWDFWDIFCFHYNPWESMRILPRNSSWGQDFVVSSPIQWRSDESQPGEGWQILGFDAMNPR